MYGTRPNACSSEALLDLEIGVLRAGTDER